MKLKLKWTMGLLFTGFLLSTAFMNCSGPAGVEFSNTQSKVASDETDNGRPYDGKVYFLIGDLCSDGTNVRARIRLKDQANADLVRSNCNEIAPVALGANDFQVNSANPSELQYQNQIFINALLGSKMDMTQVYSDGGNAYQIVYDFGTTPDDLNNNLQSRLRLFEDGKLLGPAHSLHPDIRNIGLGRFSHWWSGISSLRFSSSDNTNPLTNGRTYTWDVY